MRGEILQKMRVALPTKENGGMEDVVADVFGRAKTFTIIDIDGKEVQKVEVIQNPAESYKHGAGPIVVKTLVDLGVTMVAAKALGIGASTLLEHHNVKRVTVNAGVKVAKALQNVMR